MNIKQNFKQSWHIIKQNKLFSGIYIFGTAISIAMVMVIAIVWLAKTADSYPEVNRSRMMTIKGIIEKSDEGGWSSSYVSHKFVKDFILSTNTIECVSEVMVDNDPGYITVAGDDIRYKVTMTYADSYFWKIFQFKFLAGTPFSEEDVASGITRAVISEKVAKEHFGGAESAVGKHFLLNFVDYSVCGVVKNVSGVMSLSYADIWIPIPSNDGELAEYGHTGYLGSSNVYILARSSRDFSKIKSEVSEKVAAFNNTSKSQMDLLSQPEPYATGILRAYSNQDVNMNSYILKMVLVVLLFLIVPAINLAGMISSRMSKRMEEMGIRKTFGAPKKSILFQIINENLLLTLIGGVVGIALSYVLLAIGGDMIMGLIVPTGSGLGADSLFNLSMLMNPWIFVIAFAICLILNLLAAIIPAVHSLNNNIVDSLNVKK